MTKKPKYFHHHGLKSAFKDSEKPFFENIFQAPFNNLRKKEFPFDFEFG